MANVLKTVFHVHTDYSDDSNISISHLIDACAHRKVNCIAVTDHDTIAGARELAAHAGPSLRVIIGEEISTIDGHLIGLFLRERIEPGMPVRRSAEAIHDQGGLVVVPHPFNRIFGCSLNEKVYEILDLILSAPREAGTEGALQARRTLREHLSALGYAVEEEPFRFSASIRPIRRNHPAVAWPASLR